MASVAEVKASRTRRSFARRLPLVTTALTTAAKSVKTLEKLCASLAAGSQRVVATQYDKACRRVVPCYRFEVLTAARATLCNLPTSVILHSRMSGVKEAYDQLAIDSLQLRFQQEYEHLCE